MSEDIDEEYRAFKGNQHGSIKGRLDVHFPKVWGSKAFFMHPVRFGTSSDTAEKLRVFGTFQDSREYKDIADANAKKSQENRRLKLKRDRFRLVRHRSDHDVEQYLKAKAGYETLGRGSPAGFSQTS